MSLGHIGHESSLVRDFGPEVHESIIDSLVSILTSDKVFDEFSIIFDGTPKTGGLEAEAITFVLVTKDHEIIHLLVRARLFSQKLNGEELAAHVVEAIERRCKKNHKDWMASANDSAATNFNALRRIIDPEFGDEANYRADAKPTKTPCCSHSLSNTCKLSLGTKGAANFAHFFRKSWNPVINHPGEARKNASPELFGGKPVVIGGGVRFGVHYEQAAQLAEAGLPRVVEFAKMCAENGYSEASSKSLLDSFDPGMYLLRNFSFRASN